MASLISDPYLTPAIEAPPGLHSNLVDPPSTSYSTIIICVLIIVLSTPFVLLRLYTRKFITRHVWWDDCQCSHRTIRFNSSSMLMGCDRVLRPGLDLRDCTRWSPLESNRLRRWYRFVECVQGKVYAFHQGRYSVSLQSPNKDRTASSPSHKE